MSFSPPGSIESKNDRIDSMPSMIFSCWVRSSGFLVISIKVIYAKNSGFRINIINKEGHYADYYV